jgi:hypothetical protein
VTGYGYLERNGGPWCDFYFKDGQWQMGADVNDPMGSDIWAHENEFYTLTEEGQEPKILVIHVWRRWVSLELEEAMCQEVYHIVADDNGHLKVIHMPEYTLTDVDVDNEEPYGGPFPRIKLKSPKDKLEPIQAHFFLKEKE